MNIFYFPPNGTPCLPSDTRFYLFFVFYFSAAYFSHYRYTAMTPCLTFAGLAKIPIPSPSRAYLCLRPITPFHLGLHHTCLAYL